MIEIPPLPLQNLTIPSSPSLRAPPPPPPPFITSLHPIPQEEKTFMKGEKIKKTNKAKAICYMTWMCGPQRIHRGKKRKKKEKMKQDEESENRVV